MGCLSCSFLSDLLGAPSQDGMSVKISLLLRDYTLDRIFPSKGNKINLMFFEIKQNKAKFQAE